MQSILWSQVLIVTAATGISLPILAHPRDRSTLTWLALPFLLAGIAAYSCSLIHIS